MITLKRIAIEGFKSIQKMALDLRQKNVLIGANGIGKSNFLSFFPLLRAVANHRIDFEVEKSGGAQALLHYGPKITSRIVGQTWFETPGGPMEHLFALSLAAGDRLIYEGEKFVRPHPDGKGGREISLAVYGGFNRPAPDFPEGDDSMIEEIRRLADELQLFHFHDTSFNAAGRLTARIEDNRQLHADGGNLPAVLYKLQQRQSAAYRRIVGALRQIAPDFDDFVLEPRELNPDTILLQWRERNRDYIFGPHQVSDGTLRAMALVTLLSQSRDDLPDVLILDEPELGLHPAALNLVAGLIKAAAHSCQILVATQSAALVDAFEPEDVVVVGRRDAASSFTRLDSQELRDWLEEYTLGELWAKNVFGGGPFG